MLSKGKPRGIHVGYVCVRNLEAPNGSSKPHLKAAAERRPLTRPCTLNMIAFVLWRIFKWGPIKAGRVGRNTVILPCCCRCRTMGRVMAQRLTKPCMATMIHTAHSLQFSLSNRWGSHWVTFNFHILGRKMKTTHLHIFE